MHFFLVFIKQFVECEILHPLLVKDLLKVFKREVLKMAYVKPKRFASIEF
jgi:hypothetical protein